MRVHLPLVTLLAACSGINDVTFVSVEEPTFQVQLTLDAPITDAGAPLGYEATLLDRHGNVVQAELDWTLTSELEPDLVVTGTEIKPVVAGDHAIVASVDFGAGTWTGDAPLVVRAGAAWDVDLRLDDHQTQAGEAVGYEVVVLDAWGNVLEEPAVDVTVDDPALTILPDTLETTLPGVYLVTATFDEWDDPEILRVVPGPAAAIDLELSTTQLELFETTTGTVEVTDAYGNPTDDPWEITTDRPTVTVVSNRNVTFFEEGWFTVTATVVGTTLTDSVGPFVIDSTGPVIDIWPPRGHSQTPGTVAAQGTVFDDWSAPVDLAINGSAVTVQSTGAYMHPVALDFGVTVLDTVASDQDGNVTTDTRAVLQGGFKGAGQKVLDGIEVRINEGTGGLGTLEVIGEDLVRATDLDALIPRPLYSAHDEGCFDPCGGIFGGCEFCVTLYDAKIYVDNPRISDVDLQIDPRSTGELWLTGAVLNPRLDWSIDAEAFEIFSFSGDGDIAASRIATRLYTRPKVQSTFIMLPLTDSPDAWIDHLDFNWDYWVWDVFRFFNLDTWIEGFISGAMEDAIEDVVKDEVPPAVEDALQDLELGYDFALSGRTYAFDAYPGSIWVNGSGLTLGLDASAKLLGNPVRTAPQTTLANARGSLFRGYTPPTWGNDPKMNVGISGDLLSQLLHAAWSGGVLDLDMTGSELGLNTSDLSLFLPGVSTVYVQVRPVLPPVVVPGVGSDEFELQMGDLEIILYNGGPTGPVLIDTYVTAFAPLDLDNDSDIALTAEIGQPEIYFDVVVPDANSMGATDTEALLEALVPLLMPRLEDALGQIDIPAIQGFRISGIQIDSAGSEDGYVTLGGNLIEQ